MSGRGQPHSGRERSDRRANTASCSPETIYDRRESTANRVAYKETSQYQTRQLQTGMEQSDTNLATTRGHQGQSRALHVRRTQHSDDISGTDLPKFQHIVGGTGNIHCDPNGRLSRIIEVKGDNERIHESRVNQKTHKEESTITEDYREMLNLLTYLEWIFATGQKVTKKDFKNASCMVSLYEKVVNYCYQKL